VDRKTYLVFFSFWEKFSPLAPKQKGAVNLTIDFLRIFFGDICHILKENYQKLPHLGTPFKEVASSKQDFEKNLRILI
jgi:hypothetical protein